MIWCHFLQGINLCRSICRTNTTFTWVCGRVLSTVVGHLQISYFLIIIMAQKRGIFKFQANPNPLSLDTSQFLVVTSVLFVGQIKSTNCHSFNKSIRHLCHLNPAATPIVNQLIYSSYILYRCV